jgi:hypothetical protein
MIQPTAPGWADLLGKKLASKSEEERADAVGWKPRRCFRQNDYCTNRAKKASLKGHATQKLIRALDESEEK